MFCPIRRLLWVLPVKVSSPPYGICGIHHMPRSLTVACAHILLKLKELSFIEQCPRISIIITMWGWYYYHHFIDEVTEAQKDLFSFPRTTKLGTTISIQLKAYTLSTTLDSFPALFVQCSRMEGRSYFRLSLKNEWIWSSKAKFG